MIIDIHTHNTHAHHALINVEPGFTPVPGQLYSLAIHPWHATQAGAKTIKQLQAQATLPQVKAIGETGLDKNHPSPECQTQLLLEHIALSEKLKKPLILHIVRTYNEIIQLSQQVNPTQPWIIHGFRGKPQLAAQLLSHGFYISLGEHYNPETARIIPSNRLLIETDESTASANALAARHPAYDPTLPIRLFSIN
ncbi:TatD family hydrolase [uncultured Muribaculum sp.]|uniref:TatD family hydrolase n=1 Tax=uncultured Muribaculum sp. TaxID=1918613 RepID=UPI002730E050|nr:TatD family hydrolase [uncultured Muribaculum sp.]